MFSNRDFKVGDEVASIEFGSGNVVNIIEHANFGVVVQFEDRRDSYTYDGKENPTDAYPSLFHRDNNPFEMAGKYEEARTALIRIANKSNEHELII